MIPDEHVERARSVPIERIIEERGRDQTAWSDRARWSLSDFGGGSDRFSINVKKQVFNCRGCSVGGDVIGLVQYLDGVDFVTACSTLAGPAPKANGRDKDKDSAKTVVVATFEYHDEHENVLFVKERVQFQKPDGAFVLKDGKPDRTF